MSAVINSHYKVCTILLQLPHFKNTINDTNVNGETALHFAFITESKEIIKLLRLHGATLNAHASAFKFICQRFTPKGELLPPPTSCRHLVKRYRSTKDVVSNPSPMGN
jgi:ankyrin repeat protein